MQLPVLAIVGAIAAIVCVVVCLQVLEARRTATRRDAFSREAAQRGWRYACTTEGGTRTDRFEGTSLAGSWTAEVIERRGRKRPGVRLMRWWNGRADAPPPAAGPFVLVLAVDADQRLPEEEPADGALARFAARAVQMALGYGVGFRFGTVLPADRLVFQRVGLAGPAVEDFAFLSDQPDAARRRLSPAFLDALRRAFPQGGWDSRRARRPWLGLVGDRVAIACMSETVPDAADVARLVDAGAIVAGVRS